MTAPPSATHVLLCPDGPMLVRGPVSVEDESGTVHVSRRPTTAVCRCGLSSAAPWCDGAHKTLRARAAARTDHESSGDVPVGATGDEEPRPAG